MKPSLLVDVGGTLRFWVPEGTPDSGATVSVFDETGAPTAVAGSTATIAGRELSIGVSAGICDYIAENYRARWTYTVAGETYRVDQTFDVSRAIIRAPCDEQGLLDQYPILTKRYPAGQSSHAPQLDGAWEDILGRIRQIGKLPNRVISSHGFRRAHATLAAALVAENLGVGSATTSEWQALAEMWRQRFDDQIKGALAATDWYDASDDLLPSAAETRADLTVTRCER